MPATRQSSRVQSKGKELTASSHRLAAMADDNDDDVIIISSDEEDMNSASYALRKAQQEVRSLKRKLAAKEASSSQVLLDQRNRHADDPVASSSARLVKSQEERVRLEGHLQQATTDIKKLQSVLQAEKESKAREIKRMNKRATAAEIEIASLKVKNQELKKNSGGNGNKALHDLENHILCEVCTERLWNPYTLSGCGHTFCQECLTDWLNTAIAANAYQPQYTCPTCRSPVYHKPVENYALKGVVRAISQAIDPSGRSPPAPPRNQGGVGPWSRFFG